MPSKEDLEKMMSEQLRHIPVLTDEVVQNIIGDRNGTYVDATFGGGGHSKRILEVLGEDGRLISFDLDDDAVDRGEKLALEDNRFTIIKSNFSDMQSKLGELGIKEIDGVVFDLGPSTLQLLSHRRGFSFKFENAFLDMRMNGMKGETAADVLNTASRDRLNYIFKRYGEINNPSRLINNISDFRKLKDSISTVKDLNDIIENSWDRKVDPYKFVNQCYQALRIEVNQELTSLDKAMDSLQNIVKKGGKVAIITFHSLEDERVKKWKSKFCDGINIPDYGNNVVNQFSLISSGCIFPSDLEKAQNWSSRSAKLWLAKKN